jgi:hypothetical protein
MARSWHDHALRRCEDGDMDADELIRRIRAKAADARPAERAGQLAGEQPPGSLVGAASGESAQQCCEEFGHRCGRVAESNE